tara:strand:+ start:544 stop:1074 length:531 start_codon:yes stop_codon:yes gene_type:complete
MKDKIICFLVFIVGLIIVCNIVVGKEGLGGEESVIVPDTEPVITPMPGPIPVEPIPVDPVEPIPVEPVEPIPVEPIEPEPEPIEPEPVEPSPGHGGGHRPGHGGGHRPGPGHRPRRNTFWGFYRSLWPFRRPYYPVNNKVIEITDNYEYPNSTLYWLLFIMVCIILVLYADHKNLI